MVHLLPVTRLRPQRGDAPKSQSQTPGRGATGRPLCIGPTLTSTDCQSSNGGNSPLASSTCYSLGPRILASFLLEASDDPIPELIRRLEDYQRLSPEVAAALGANDWTTPLRPGRQPRHGRKVG